jgi:hypothetical protein
MGHVAYKGERRSAHGILVGTPEWKLQLGRPRRRWEDNIKMNLNKIGCDGVEWIDLALDREKLAISSCESSDEPTRSIKCG